MSVLELSRFEAEIERMSAQFREAAPFPNIVIDNFLPD